MSQIAGEPATQDFVEVRLPAAGAYLSVLRTATAGLAARLDFTLDEIEDLRIAVDEACAILLQQAVPGSVLSCVFRLVDDSLEVTVSAPTTDGHAPSRDTFAWTVLSALAGKVVLRRRRGQDRVDQPLQTARRGTRAGVRNGDGPVRDEERGTRELPAGERRSVADVWRPERFPPHGGRHRRHPRAGPAASGGRLVPAGCRRAAAGQVPCRAAPRAGADRGRPRCRAAGEGSGEGDGRDNERARARRRAERAGHAARHAGPRGTIRDGPQRGAGDVRRAARSCTTAAPEYAELRNRLVRMHLPLVEHLARRFRNRGEPLDDLTQVATIGLIKSVDRFDPERGVEFSTYATPTVVGEIKRHFRDKGWAVRVPRRLQELRLALTTATGGAVPAARPLPHGPRAGREAGDLARRRSWRAWSPPTRTPRCRWTSPTPTTSPRRSRTRSARRTRRWRASSTGSRSSRCWRTSRRARSGSCCCGSSAT